MKFLKPYQGAQKRVQHFSPQWTNPGEGKGVREGEREKKSTTEKVSCYQSLSEQIPRKSHRQKSLPYIAEATADLTWCLQLLKFLIGKTFAFQKRVKESTHVESLGAEVCFVNQSDRLRCRAFPSNKAENGDLRQIEGSQ
jgi:hypothetical protein